MTTDTVGGVWSFSKRLAYALARQDLRVTLAAMGPKEPDERFEDTRHIELVYKPFRLEWMREPWGDIARAEDWLLELRRRLNPDLVHLNTLVQGGLDWRCPVLTVGHSCVLSWHSEVHGRPAPRSWEHYRERVTASLRASDAVTAPSQTMLSWLQRDYGPFRAVEPVYNGLPHREAQDSEFNKEQAAEDPDADLWIFSAGRLWDEAKNTQALAAVASELPCRVAFAGDTVHPDGGHVEYSGLCTLGWLDHPSMEAWYKRASIYALPARYEPFGLTALEAARQHCALVLGDIPTLREIWGDTARYVDPDDIEGLRQTLLDLCHKPEERHHQSERAYCRSLALTEERTRDGYLSIYKELLRHSATPQASSTSTRSYAK